MEKDFQFSTIGKRMPYTIPDGFFAGFEERMCQGVRREAASRSRLKPSRLRLWAGWAVAAAAVLAFFFVVDVPQAPASAADGFTEVEQAFSNLSSEDRAFLLEVYQDDVFINV